MREIGKDGAALVTEQRKNYNAKISFGQDTAMEGYSKKQMKALYPDGGFRIVGEYAPDAAKERAGSFTHNGKTYPLYEYKSANRLMFSEKGYAACSAGTDAYIAILKNVWAPRLTGLLACAAAAAVLAAALPGLSMQNTLSPAGVELEEGAVDWQGALPEDTGGVTEGIRIPGYKSVTIAAHTKDVQVSFVNPEKNNCYFVISLILSDTGETIYKSKMIKPGLGLYEITLTRELDPGTYAAVISYDTFSLAEPPSPLNGARVNIDLIVT